MEVENDKNRAYSGVLYIFRRDEAFKWRKFYLGSFSFNFSSLRLFITCKGMLIDDFTCWNKHPRYTASLPLIIPPSKKIAPSFSPRLVQYVLILLKSKKSKVDELLRRYSILKNISVWKIFNPRFNSENMFELIHMFRGGLLGIKYSWSS